MSFTGEQLLPDEQLVIVARQHWIVLVKAVLLNLVFLAILLGIAHLFDLYWLLLLCLIPALLLAWELFVRHRREYVITDRRVVRHEGVFTVSSFDAPLDKINNVFHQQTLWGRLFKYGRVGLETASEQGTTIFDFIPRPVEFKNCIVRQREMVKTSGASAQSAPLQDVPKMLQDLAALRERNIISEAEFEAKKKALLSRI
jgi:uncharacterized membrane protein YdbT with pleckstrin-like domain